MFEDQEFEFADIVYNENGSTLVTTCENLDVATVICQKYSCIQRFEFGAQGIHLHTQLGTFSNPDNFALMGIDQDGLMQLFVINITDVGINVTNYQTTLTGVNAYSVMSDFSAAVINGKDRSGQNQLVVLDLETNKRQTYLMEDGMLCRHLAFVTKYNILVVDHDFALVGLINLPSNEGELLHVKPIITTSPSMSDYVWYKAFTTATKIPRFFVAYDDVIKQIDFHISKITGKVCGVGKVTDVPHPLNFGLEGNIISIMSSADGLSLTQTVYHHERDVTEKAVRTTTH